MQVAVRAQDRLALVYLAARASGFFLLDTSRQSLLSVSLCWTPETRETILEWRSNTPFPLFGS